MPSEPERAPLPAFGQIVLERGLATREEIEDCLRFQESRAGAGDFVRLGQVFVEKGILSPTQVQDILRSQRLVLLACTRCGTRFNRAQETGVVGGICPRCGGLLAIPASLDSTAVEDTLTAAQEEASREAGLKILSDRTRSFGPFEIIGEISRGGMGIVYKAREKELDRTVALKVLLAGGESAAEDIDRFEREARAVARLRHPCIVEIHRIGVHQGIHYFSMNYIQGISLDKILEEGKALTRQLVECVARIAEAIEYAHRKGVIHRDIKPANILINQKGEPYLIDFGIAKFRDEGSHGTKSGTFLGSPQYMAPEYISGRAKRFDPRADIYALGIALYKVLTGKTPFGEGDTVQILHRVLASAPPPIDLAAEGVDRDLAAICARAIERNPDERYQAAGEFAADLFRYLRGEEVSARPRGPLFRLRRWLRSRASIVFNFALGLSLVVVVWILHSTADEHARRADEFERQLGESQKRGRDLRYELHLERARRLSAEGNLPGAVEALGSAIQTAPDRSEAFRLRAEAYDSLGRPEEAAADRRKAEDLAAGRSGRP
ncbi:MAG: protein kinase [Planctomycetes bacterium]|nr:protein kinase [Planctomycetota bacterium]